MEARPAAATAVAAAAVAAAALALAALLTCAALAPGAAAAVSVAAANAPAWDWAIATTAYGAVRGRPMLSSNGRIFLAFLGVPYARPPVGEFRFRAPRPLQKWQGVRDARTHAPVCPQLSRPGEDGSRDVIGSEDCLYLNVYARQAARSGNWASGDPRGSKRAPVLLWVHGGSGFATGSASAGDIGPDILMDRDVVLVVPQYRLGVLGFFSTSDGVAPGNYALKDLLAALRWTHANAAAFGGDARRVTVAGAGCGSALAHLLALAPLTHGMVHRVACVGGSALAPWAFQRDPRPAARALVTAVGCTPVAADAPGRVGRVPFTEEVMRCLRRANVATLVMAGSKFSHWSSGGAAAFAPVVERQLQEPRGSRMEPRFLVTQPDALVRMRSQPPALFVAATGSSSLLPAPLRRADSQQRRVVLRELRDALQRMLVRGAVGYGGAGTAPALTASATALQRALTHYGGALGDGDVRPLTDALADGWLGHAASLAARRMAPFSSNPVYYLLLDLGPTEGAWRGKPWSEAGDGANMIPRTASDVADYVEQLQPKPGPPAVASSGAWRAAQALALVLEAFAARGEPAPARWAAAHSWRPLGQSGRFRLLLAARDGVRAQDAPRALLARMEFWDEQMIGLHRLLVAAAAPASRGSGTKSSRGKIKNIRWKDGTDSSHRLAADEFDRQPIKRKIPEDKKRVPVQPFKKANAVKQDELEKTMYTSLEYSKKRLQQLEQAIWEELENLRRARTLIDQKGSLQLLPEAVRRVKDGILKGKTLIEPQRNITDKKYQKQQKETKTAKRTGKENVILKKTWKPQHASVDIQSNVPFTKRKYGNPGRPSNTDTFPDVLTYF